MFFLSKLFLITIGWPKWQIDGSIVTSSTDIRTCRNIAMADASVAKFFFISDEWLFSSCTHSGSFDVNGHDNFDEDVSKLLSTCCSFPSVRCSASLSAFPYCRSERACLVSPTSKFHIHLNCSALTSGVHSYLLCTVKFSACECV